MYTQAANNHRNLDRLLYDIPEEEYRYRRTQTPRKHLRIASLPDDRTAEKMTSFNIGQLGRLYACFGLEQYCLSNGSNDIHIHTGH